MARPIERKRAGGSRSPKREKPLRDQLLVWRGYVLVSIGGGVLAAIGSYWYAREEDFLTASLFTLALFLLMFVTLYALGRVRRIRDAIQKTG